MEPLHWITRKIQGNGNGNGAAEMTVTVELGI
jgi:hypothetical protein